MDVSVSTISVYFKKVGYGKKLDKYLTHELSEVRFRHFKFCLMLHLWNLNEPFLKRKVTCDERKQPFLVLINHRPCCLIETKGLNTCHKRNCTNTNLYWISGGPPLALSIPAFWNLTGSSLPNFTVSNLIKCTFS